MWAQNRVWVLHVTGSVGAGTEHALHVGDRIAASIIMCVLNGLATLGNFCSQYWLVAMIR